MIAFEISLNGAKICVAGQNESGVITVIFNWRKDAGESREQMNLVAGRLDNSTNEHEQWMGGGQVLEKGDEVVVRLIECEEASPATPYPISAPITKEQYLLELAEELGWTVVPPQS